jgi:hypothetical protein
MTKRELDSIKWRLEQEVKKYRRAEWMDDETFVKTVIMKIAANNYDQIPKETS